MEVYLVIGFGFNKFALVRTLEAFDQVVVTAEGYAEYNTCTNFSSSYTQMTCFKRYMNEFPANSNIRIQIIEKSHFSIVLKNDYSRNRTVLSSRIYSKLYKG